MANDIEITVRVSNHSDAGLSSTTQSLNRLKSAARDTSTSMERLRATMSRDVSLRVRLDDTTEASITRLREAVASLRDTAPIQLRVRLDSNATATMAEIKATLRDLRGTGGVRLSVRLDDRTRAGLASVQTAIRTLKAESPVRLAVEFRGDAAQITAAATSMRELHSRAGAAGTAVTSLATRAAAAAAALLALEHGADEASEALRELRTRAAAASAALLELRGASTGLSTSLRSVSRSAGSADGRMESMSGRADTLRGRMGQLDESVRRAGSSMGSLRGSLGSMSTSTGNATNSTNRLIQAALTLAPALVPIAAAAAPVVTSMGAAGAATAIFAAALIPQFKAISDSAKAEDKYTSALGKHGAASAQAAQAESKFLEQVGATPQATQEAAAALDGMKAAYQSWSDSLASTTLPVATKSFAVLTGLFPKLTPVVQSASAQLGRFMTILAGGVQSPGFEKFMNRFAVFASETLSRANLGVLRLADSLSAGGSMRGGLAEFIQFTKTNGPLVAETLKNLAEALGRILVASASAGLGLLSIVNAFAKLINAIPSEVLSRLVQLAVAFSAVRMAAAGMAAIAPGIAAASTAVMGFIRSAQFGGVSAAISGVAQSLSALQKSTIVLAVLTAVAIGINELAEKAKGAPPDVDRLATSLKNLGTAGKFTGELKKTFGDMDGFVTRVNEMRTVSSEFDKAKSFTSLVPMGPIIERFTGKLDDLVHGTKSLGALKADIGAFDESFANLAKSGHADEAAAQFKRFEDALRGSGKSTAEIAALFPQYQAVVASLKAEQELAARAMGLFGEQAVAVKAKLDAQKQSADGLRQAIQALNDTNRQALGGMIGFEAAIDAAAKAAADNAGALHMVDGVLDLNSEKARNAASALQDLAAKTDEAAGAARENGASWESVNGIYERGREKLIAAADQMGLTRAQAAALAGQILQTPDKTAMLRGNMDDLQAKLTAAKAQLASVPDSRKAEVRANIADLEAKIARAQSELYNLSDRTVYIRTIYQHFTEQHPGGQAQAHGGIIGAAGGGPRSRMTLVGEQGPELVDLAPGSRVRSNPDSRRIADGMAGGGGGGTTVLEIRSSGSRIDDLVLEILRRAVRVKGGDVQLVVGSNR